MDLDQLTYKINGCAMKVHNTLGNGFQEVIYQRCLAIELRDAGISFQREESQTIYYEGIDVGTRRADFIIEECVIVELKAVINLENVHLAQAKNYVVAYNKPIGLLINFGSTSLQFKKVYNQKYDPNYTAKHHSQIIAESKPDTAIKQSKNSVNPDSDK